MAILPAVSTLIWEIAVQLGQNMPFTGALVTMIALNYGSFYLNAWGGLKDKALQVSNCF